MCDFLLSNDKLRYVTWYYSSSPSLGTNSMKRQKHKRINLCISAVTLCSLFMLLFVGLQAFAQPTSLNRNTKMEALQKKGQVAYDIAVLKAKLAQMPQDFSIRNKLAMLYVLAGNTYEAEILLAQAQMNAPDSPETLLLGAAVALGPIVSQGDPNTEERISNRLIALENEARENHPDTPELLYISGMRARLQANMDEAEESLLRALYQRPGFIEAQQALVDLYTDQDQVKLAIPVMAQLMDELPEDIDNYYLLGKLFYKKEDPERALHYLLESAARDPQERPIRLFWIAESQRQLGKMQDAADSYEKLLAIWPERTDILMKYARLCDGLNQQDKALAMYRKAYQTQPGIINPFLKQAEHAFWNQSMTSALPHYEKVAAIAPDRIDVLTLMANIHFRLWEEGVPPSLVTMDTLQSRLRRSQNTNSDPILQLAEIQIEVMRANGWTPGLRQVTLGIASEEGPAAIRAIAHLMLDQPDQAQQLAPDIGLENQFRLDIQRLALLGAWPWARQAVSENPKLQGLQPELEAWISKQITLSSQRLTDARLFLSQGNTEQTALAVQQALVYHPFSAEAFIIRSRLALQSGEVEPASRYIAVAQALGLSPEQQEQVNALQSQLGKASNGGNIQK